MTNQTAAVEGAPAPQPPTPEQPILNEASVSPDKRPNPGLEALARRERQLRHQSRAVQAEKQALKARQAEIEAQVSSQWKQKISSSPWDAMIEAGLTPEQATEIILNKPAPETFAVQQLQKELEALKKETESQKAQMASQVSNQYNEAKRHMAMEANLIVKADPNLEPIKAMGAQAAIPQLIEDVFNRGLPGKYPRGYVLSVEESAKLVNDYLIDEGVRIAKIGAIQKRLTPTSSKPPVRTDAQQPKLTLSNLMTATTKPSLSDRERRERAILAYEGKL